MNEFERREVKLKCLQLARDIFSAENPERYSYSTGLNQQQVTPIDHKGKTLKLAKDLYEWVILD